MTKHSVICLGFRPFSKNTLIGFVSIKIPELQLVINDVALHQRGSSRWAQLPARQHVKDGAVVTDPKTGKAAWSILFKFETKAATDAFSRAVWDACEECIRGAAA